MAIVVVLLVALAGGGLLLPRQLTVSHSVAIKAPSSTVMRCLTEKDKWTRWWPAASTSLRYPEQNFGAAQQMNSSLLVGVPWDDSVVSSLLMAIQVNKDSSIASWTASLQAGSNPLHRISAWMKARKLKSEFSAVLHRLQDFAGNAQNVYGMPVRETTVKDPYLVATRAGSRRYPSNEEVYAQVNKLRTYIQSAGARPTGAPMLHVETLDSSQYEFMVALPVDRLLPGQGDIRQKRMVMGRLLEAEVRGGDYSVRRGMGALEDYLHDYQYKSPAIPYASLTTDRRREPDSSKWVTHLYYPVF